MNLFKIYILLFLTFFLSSCVPATIVTSFTLGNLATREKTIANTKKDVEIEYIITSKLISKGIFSINPLVEDGRVFLMGLVLQKDSPNVTEAIRISWEESGVIEVINEVQLIQDSDIALPFSIIKDSAITLIANSRVSLLGGVKYSNYKFKTINSVVYVMGIAQNESELQKVSEAIANINMVKKVISHAIYADDKRRG
jgi:osmotically-inducible protein OsmY